MMTNRCFNSISDMPEWKHQYFKSCDKYIMAETLSPTFVGLQFKEV